MAQVKGQSTESKIERRLRGGGRGSIVFQQDYADCGTPSAIKSTFHHSCHLLRISRHSIAGFNNLTIRNNVTSHRFVFVSNSAKL